MKYLTLTALLFLPSAALAGSAANWASATLEAAEMYAVDYKADFNKTAAEPVGFNLAREGEELVASVYYTKAGTLRSYTYGCHEHGDHAHCDSQGKGEHGAYARLSSNYNAAEMAKAIDAALELFARKVAPASAIQAIKLWEAQEIRFAISYEKNGSKMEYMDCHYHGGSAMDCHRKGSIGPGEPGKK